MPHSSPAAVADTLTSPVADAVGRWREELTAAGGADPLARFEDLPEGTLDLSSAHPSGAAMFLAGRPTRLSSLFREPGALSDARRRARAIRLTATALDEEQGLRAGHLAVGMASWRRAEPVTAPVLLRPIELRPRGTGHVDYDLDLGGPVRTNPALVRLLKDSGVVLDPRELEALATGGLGFDPTPAYARLTELAGHLAGFVVRPRLVIGTFVDVVPALLAELDRLAPTIGDRDVVAALAGDETARARLATDPPALDPAVDAVAVLPLDTDQRAVLAAVTAGHSVRVEAPAGTGATQTVAAVVAALAAAGRRVLLVASQRAEIRDVVDRLDAVGLADLVDAEQPAGSPGGAADPDEARLRDRDAAARLRRQHAALHADREPWGASALTAMHALARLTALDPAPRTGVQLPGDTLRRLDRASRDAAAAALREAAELGAFDPAAGQDPWFGAELASEEEASAVRDATTRLTSELLPQLRADMTRFAQEAGISTAVSVADWGRQLDLLVAVRDTLDVFTPAVYERPVGDMVAATASGAWRAERGISMGLWERRRWQRNARELLRPGCVPPDLHAALLAAQEQRRQWQELATGGGWPRVPVGLADADGRHATVAAELSRLEKVLAHTPEGGRLLPAPLDELERRLGRLAGDHDAVEALPRRTAALATLRTLGLEPLVEDLRARSCPADQVTHELELAWWRSLLQLLLAEDPDLRAADAAAHDEALAALRAADRARQREVARRLRDARAVAGAPACRVTSPMALPQEVPAGTDVDVVVLAGAHRVGAAEGALALGRAAHVVVVGDPQGLPPVAISLEEDAPARPSVLELLDGALPTLPLHRQHRMPEQLRRCTDAVAPVTGERRLPAPPGAADVGFDFVPDGVGHPGPDGAIESVDAEIDRVVALVLEHVRQRPEESLAVIALSRPHARRVADALRDELPDQPDVARWLARGRAEPFVVTDAERAEDAVRDAAIVTLGFGRTPHGRVLHRFGRLDDEGGERRLLVALTRPRRRLRVVSCLQADDLDVERLRTPGARALHALLRCLGDGVPVAAEAGVPATERDPLLQDLARRLTDRGRSPLDGPGHGPHLVVPDREGRGAVAVLTDLDPLEDPHDLHERDLLLPDQLTRFGWRVVRLGAVGMFTDPDAQVRRVLRAAR